MRKYYNIEIAYNTRTMIDRVNNFRMWLYDNNIKHETSSAGDFVHFEILLSSDEVAKIAVVDKGHANGEEVHVVYNNGVVKIYNERTHKFITVLIARVPQIERYNVKVTKAMRKKINLHVKNGYNQIEF